MPDELSDQEKAIQAWEAVIDYAREYGAFMNDLAAMLGGPPNTPKGAPQLTERPKLRLVSSDRKAA